MLFLKWRLRRAKKKMHACRNAIMMSEKDPSGTYTEAVDTSKRRLKSQLNDLAWKYIRLSQKLPSREADPLGELVNKIGPIVIKEEQGFILPDGLSKASIEVLERVNQERSEEESLMDRLLGEPMAELTPQLISRLKERYDPFNNVMLKTTKVSRSSKKLTSEHYNDQGQVLEESIRRLKISNSRLRKIIGEEKRGLQDKTIRLLEELREAIKEWPLSFDKIVEEKVKEAEDIPSVTLKDLEAPMKEKMVEEDPGLQGDLAMLLHKLRDPVNHPVSLLDLAYQVAGGQCPGAELVASALDMLVDEYREKIGPVRNFEMSDKACLEALDVERNTIC